jgi:hypothetical protein
MRHLLGEGCVRWRARGTTHGGVKGERHTSKIEREELDVAEHHEGGRGQKPKGEAVEKGVSRLGMRKSRSNERPTSNRNDTTMTERRGRRRSALAYRTKSG